MCAHPTSPASGSPHPDIKPLTGLCHKVSQLSAHPPHVTHEWLISICIEPAAGLSHGEGQLSVRTPHVTREWVISPRYRAVGWLISQGGSAHRTPASHHSRVGHLTRHRAVGWLISEHETSAHRLSCPTPSHPWTEACHLLQRGSLTYLTVCVVPPTIGGSAPYVNKCELRHSHL